MWIPTFPGQEAVHPILVHFPIALLFIGPFLLLLALLLGKRGHGIAWAALIVMVIGTLTAIMAVRTGHMAEHAVKAANLINPANHPVLHEHEQYAEVGMTWFIAVSALLLIVMVALAVFGRKLKAWVRPVSYVVVLLLCIPAYLTIADAADLGARLVHKHHVHATISSPDPAVVHERAVAVEQADAKINRPPAVDTKSD